MDVRLHDLLNVRSRYAYRVSNYNELQRLAERQLVFNVDKLKWAATRSVDRSVSDVKSFRKLAEGGFNWLFELPTKDGLSVIARLPYPSTSPRRLAVVSEVATIDFVRANGITTPRVLGYCATENDVGSEYILIKKLQQRPIGDAWFDLSEQQRLQVLQDIVELEMTLFNIELPASGSLY